MSPVRGRGAAGDRKHWGTAAVLALALAFGGLGYGARGAAPRPSPLGAPGTTPPPPSSAAPALGPVAPALGPVAPAPIMVGQRQLFSVGGLAEQAAGARAAAINRRIASFVTHPERIAPVAVQLRGRERILSVAGRDLLSVTPQDAADNLTTVPELADSWRRELDEALSTVKAEHQTFWIEIRDSIVLSAEELLRQVAAFIPRFASALVVLFVAWFAARGARTGVRRILGPSHVDLTTQQLVRTLTYYGIWTLGWVLALGTAGIQPATLVAGLGVTTIALGFALKDLLSNFVSGFLILTTRPFCLGDQIAVREFEGTVERIELRATHLRTGDNRLIIIPNSDLYTATITNNTDSPHRRQEFIVGIDYAADLDPAAALAQRVAVETQGVLPDPAPDVLIDDLASSSVNLKVRFYTDSQRGNAITVGSAVRRRVKEAFDAAGIAIYPPNTQIVQLQDGQAPSAPSRSSSISSDTGQAQAPAAPPARSKRSSSLPPGRPAPSSSSAAGEGRDDRGGPPPAPGGGKKA